MHSSIITLTFVSHSFLHLLGELTILLLVFVLSLGLGLLDLDLLGGGGLHDGLKSCGRFLSQRATTSSVTVAANSLLAHRLSVVAKIASIVSLT